MTVGALAARVLRSLGMPYIRSLNLGSTVLPSERLMVHVVFTQSGVMVVVGCDTLMAAVRTMGSPCRTVVFWAVAVKVGIGSNWTVMVKVVELVLPAASVAVHVTSVSPSGKLLPEVAGTQLTVGD